MFRSETSSIRKVPKSSDNLIGRAAAPSQCRSRSAAVIRHHHPLFIIVAPPSAILHAT